MARRIPLAATARLVAASAAASLFTSCTGGSTALAPARGTGGPTSTVSGVVNVASWSVPASQTVTVASHTLISSSGPVSIAGTINVTPGSAFIIIAPQITIGGTIGPTASTSSSARRSVRDETGASGTTAFVSDAITVNGVINAGSGGNVDFVSPSGNGTLTIDGPTIEGGLGLAATERAQPGEPGGAMPGGNVEIGTAQAVVDAGIAAALAGKPGLSVNNPQFQTVTVASLVIGGQGGLGYNDVNGTTAGSTVTLQGTAGAKGGDVNIAAKRVIVSGQVQGGLGGLGGNAGYQGSTRFSTPVDAVIPGDSGLNLVATTGDGGPGGNFNITGAISGGGPAVGGCGNRPGSAATLRAGNGLSGGSGGTTLIKLGDRGRAGQPFYGPCDSQSTYTVVALSGGGSGDSSVDAAHPGGNAGNVTIAGKDGGAPQNLLTLYSFTNYANAGPGFSNCPGPGTKAGNPASLTVFGKDYKATNSFNGGNGGAGNPAGNGSAGGKDDAGKKIGKDGLDGNACPGASPTPTPTPSPTPTATPTPTPTPTPTSSPAPSPSPGVVNVTPPSVTLNGIGSSQTVTVSQTGNSSNTFTADPLSCPPGVGDTATVTQSQPGTFVITETGRTSAATCAVSFHGAGGQIGSVTVNFQ